MSFLPIRELRSSTEKLDSIIKRDGKAIITNHGKPAYIMLGVDENTFEDTLIDLRIIEGRRAIANIQNKAKEAGLDKLTIDEIDKEIAAARRERLWQL